MIFISSLIVHPSSSKLYDNRYFCCNRIDRFLIKLTPNVKVEFCKRVLESWNWRKNVLEKSWNSRTVYWCIIHVPVWSCMWMDNNYCGLYMHYRVRRQSSGLIHLVHFSNPQEAGIVGIKSLIRDRSTTFKPLSVCGGGRSCLTSTMGLSVTLSSLNLDDPKRSNWGYFIF